MGLFGGKPNIAKLTRARNVKGLCGALSHSNAEVRCEAARALREVGRPEAEVADALLGALLAEMRDPASRLIDDISQALREAGGPRSLDQLCAALKDANQCMRGRAALALGVIYSDARHAPHRDGYSEHVELYLGAVEALLTTLEDSDEQVRVEAIRAVGRIGEVKAVDHLLAALKACDEHIRVEATGALVKIGDAEAVEHLLSALEDIREPKGLEARGRLGDISDPGAVFKIIVQMKGTMSPHILSRCATELWNTGYASALAAMYKIAQNSGAGERDRKGAGRAVKCIRRGQSEAAEDIPHTRMDDAESLRLAVAAREFREPSDGVAVAVALGSSAHALSKDNLVRVTGMVYCSCGLGLDLDIDMFPGTVGGGPEWCENCGKQLHVGYSWNIPGSDTDCFLVRVLTNDREHAKSVYSVKLSVYSVKKIPRSWVGVR